MSILTTGNSGGHQRLEMPDKIEWGLFQREHKVTAIIVSTAVLREKHNENVFTSVNDIVEIDDDTTKIEDNISRGTHYI